MGEFVCLVVKKEAVVVLIYMSFRILVLAVCELLITIINLLIRGMRRAKLVKRPE